MAVITLTAERDGIPTELGATIVRRPWPGGGTVPVLMLWIGQDAVTVWPADPDRLRQLAAKLGVLADRLMANPKYGAEAS